MTEAVLAGEGEEPSDRRRALFTRLPRLTVCTCGPGWRGSPAGTMSRFADRVLTLEERHLRAGGRIPAGFTITQIYEGTNQIQRMVMARQLLK